ncbi:MAG: glycosyltransferase family 2 protein [Flavobacteriaceae bacterium]
MNEDVGTGATLGAFVICKDAEATIGPCLESLAAVDEIVVVDSGSKDRTLSIIEDLAAQGLPIRLYREAWRGFAGQKQFALERCTTQWCLNLDADEVLSAELAAALPALVARGDVAGWILPRRDYLAGYGLAHRWTRRGRVLRLFRRLQAAYDPQRIVHEAPLVDGRVLRASRGVGEILHFADTHWRPHRDRALRNAALKASMRYRDGRRASVLRLLFYPLGRFLRIYVMRRFFINGFAGLRYAVVGAVYAAASEYYLFRLQGERRKARA